MNSLSMNSTSLKEMIYRRKSTRSYTGEAVDSARMDAIRRFLDQLKPLEPAIRVRWEIVGSEDVQCLQPWKTPHFIAVFSQEKEGWRENAGFMFQQADLYIQSLGLGVCWVGLGWLTDAYLKEHPLAEDEKLVILLPFGVAQESPHREPSEFRRKALSEIADMPDPRLEPARVAPSATNGQPWYFVHEGDVIHACVTHLGPIKRRTHGRFIRVDLGIALAHLYAAYGEGFEFFRAEQPPEVNGYDYVGSIRLSAAQEET